MSEENRKIGRDLEVVMFDCLNLRLPEHFKCKSPLVRLVKALDEAERRGYLTGHNDGYKQGMERALSLEGPKEISMTKQPQPLFQADLAALQAGELTKADKKRLADLQRNAKDGRE